MSLPVSCILATTQNRLQVNEENKFTFSAARTLLSSFGDAFIHKKNTAASFESCAEPTWRITMTTEHQIRATTYD